MNTVYHVLSPLGERVGEQESIVCRIPDLSGKTVCEVWNGGFRGDVLFPVLRELIQERYSNVKFVPYNELPNFVVWENIEGKCGSLKEAIIRRGCDVVIAGVGG